MESLENKHSFDIYTILIDAFVAFEESLKQHKSDYIVEDLQNTIKSLGINGFGDVAMYSHIDLHQKKENIKLIIFLAMRKLAIECVNAIMKLNEKFNTEEILNIVCSEIKRLDFQENFEDIYYPKQGKYEKLIDEIENYIDSRNMDNCINELLKNFSSVNSENE